MLDMPLIGGVMTEFTGKYSKTFKIIAGIVACVFLFQQIAWAGDLIEATLNKQYAEQSQTFAPSYINSQQANSEALINQKQAIEDATNVQGVTTQVASTSVETTADDSVTLQGPKGGSGKSTAASSEISTQSLTSQDDSSVLSVTTQAGDVIYYKEGAIDYIQRKDGTILRNIVVDENDNLTDAEITYSDGTIQTVANGKVSKITKPDDTLINYNDDGSITSVVYSDGTTVNWSYTKDGQGNVIGTTLTDSQKTSIYGSDNKLEKVIYNDGKTIEYQSGVISKITEADKGQFTFAITNNPDGTFVSTLSQYTAPDGTIYKYSVDQNKSISAVTIENNGITATYGKDGALISITKDGETITAETISQAQSDYDTALALYQQKQQETENCQTVLDSANTDLANARSAADAAAVNINAAIQNLNNAQSVKDQDQAAYNTAYNNYLTAQTAYNSANTALTNAQADATAKQTAYNNAAAAVQKAQAALNMANTNLANAQQAQTSAVNALSGSPYIVSSYIYSPTSIILNQYKSFINDSFSSYNSTIWYKPTGTLVTMAGGAATLNGTGKNYNATFYTNQSYNRTDEPILSTSFKVSSTSGQFIAALDGYTSSNSYRRVGIYVQGGNIYLQTVSGSTTTNVATLASGAKANTNYNLEFDITSQYIKVYLWAATGQKPASPSYIYSVNDWTAVRPYFSLYSGTATVNPVTLKGPTYTSIYNSSSQLVQDTYQDGSVSTYSYSTNTVTISNYLQYLSAPYDLTTANLWYKAATAPVTISNGIATLKGSSKDYSATFYSNQTFARASDIDIRSTFQATSTSSNFIDALDGYTSSGVYRRVGIVIQNGKIYVQTVSGSTTSTPATLISTAKANTNYTVEFQVTGQNILIYLWQSSGTKPTNPSYTYAVTDWATVRPYYSVYSGTATVSNMYINYVPQIQTVSSGSIAYSQILTRNQLVKNLNNTIVNVNTAQASYNSANTTLTNAKADAAAKQTAYNNAVAAAQKAQAAFNTANANLTQATSTKDQANLALQTAIKNLATAQTAKDASQVAYNSASAAYSKAQTAYNQALADLNSAKSDEASTKTQADLLLATFNTLNSVSSIFPSQDKALADADKELNIINVLYDAQANIEQVNQMDGTVEKYADGLPTSVSDSTGSTLYSYDISSLNNINAITIDSDGIKRIYDEYGSLQSVSLSDASQIIYENGKVSEIDKADGTKIKNMTFTDTGDLDSALISYPDGSMALYQDAQLLQIINQSGDKINYSDGKIRQVTLQDGTVYNWSYDTNGNIIILDSVQQEKRVYSQGKLIQVQELTGTQLTTNYTYDPNSGNLMQSQVCQNGEVLYTYTYEYKDNLTLIHDENGNTQAYNSDKKLTYIIDSTGKQYFYTYVGKSEGCIEVYFPSGVKVRYDTNDNIVDATASDGTVISNITFDANNNPVDFTYVKDNVTYKIVNGSISEVTDKDGTIFYYDNGFIKSIQSSLEKYQYYITDSKVYKDASFFQPGSGNNISYYINNNVASLMLSTNNLQFGNGSDGVKHITANTTLDAGTYNFTSLVIDSGKILTVTSGTTINCLDTIDIKGTLSGSGITINSYTVTVESGGVVTGTNQNITANAINNQGTMETLVSSILPTSYDVYQAGGNLDRSVTQEASFPACTISKLVYNLSATAGTDGYSCAPYKSSYCAIYVNYVSTGWTLIYSNSGTDSASLNNISMGSWGPITGVRAYVSSSAHADHDCRVTANIANLQIYADPQGTYVNGTGTIPATLSNNQLCPASGTFTSNVIEIDSLTLDNISWNESLPAGTSISIETRTGNTATPDSTWSDWSSPMTNQAGSTMTTAESKYIQYKITLTTSNLHVTPALNLSATSPLSIGFKRAPVDSSELSDISYITREQNGVTYGYNTNGLLIWMKDASGKVTTYDPPDTTDKIDPSKLVFDYTYADDLKSLLPTLILNDTQKNIYMKDNIIVSELTAIDNADGSQAEYVQGKLSKITTADGVEITNITFDENNKANDFTYVKNGTTYIVRDKEISEEITPTGEHIKYYPYGMEESVEDASSKAEYDYGIQTANTYTTNQVFQAGDFNNTSFYNNGNTSYLELSSTNLKFGDGSNGDKHVTANETLAAGTYNFTSLTIDAGKTLTVADGATINCLDTITINGKLSGLNLNINAYTITIAVGGALSGAGQHLNANTINNQGSMISDFVNYATTAHDGENVKTAQYAGSMTYYGSMNSVNDGDAGTYWGMWYSKGGSGDLGITMHTRYIANFTTPVTLSSIYMKGYLDCSNARHNGGCSGNGYVRILQNGTWVTIESWSTSNGIVSTDKTDTGNWANVTSIEMYEGLSGGGDRECSAQTRIYDLRAYTTPTCEYISSAGSVPLSSVQYLYPSSGTFDSSVMELDALTLDKISWSEYLPSGTAITIQTRTGDTATPDDTWSDWSNPVSDPTGSKITSPCGKYLQYRVNMATTDPTVTPRIILDNGHAIAISYTKFSDSLTDPYVQVKENDITKAYNKNGVLIWQEDLLGNKTTYDPSNPQGTIDLTALKFDSTYIYTLNGILPTLKLGDAQKVITVYDQGNNVPMETIDADQSITYYDNGYAQQVVDKNGVLEVQYTYDSNNNIIGVDFVDARNQLEASYEAALANISTQKDQALAKLADSAAQNKSQIDANIANAQKQIDDERQTLTIEESQYDPNVYDLSAFTQALAQLDSYQAQLNQQAQAAYADLNNQVANATAQINANAQVAMQNLINGDYNKILGDIVQKESSPIIYQYYRSVLGRDPGDDELSYWMGVAQTNLKPISPTDITQYIENLSEYADRQARKQNIISSLTTFFTQYFSASSSDKQTMLASLGLTSSDVVNLTQSDIDAITAWLNGQSLHFGDSAINTVVTMLKNAGINKSFNDVGKDVIKIDILTGVITKDTTGDLVISMYAMRKAASIEGLTLYSEKISYDDLKDQVSRNNVIVHINGNHYALVTSIDDVNGTITYIDTTVGKTGQSMTVSKAEFMGEWKGYALSTEAPKDPAKEISITVEKNIRGSSWWSQFWKGIVNFFQKILAPIGAILLFTPFAPIGAVLIGLNIVVQTISFVVHTGTLMDVVWSVVNGIGAAIGSMILPSIYSAAGNIFSQISANIPAAINGIFQSVMSVFQPITDMVRDIATGIGQIVTLGLQDVQVATSIGYNIIKEGISLGTDYLFQSLHIDPTLSNIGSALFSGAVMGAIEDTNIVASALEYGTIAGVQDLGKAVGLDPNITQLSAIMAGSLVGGALDLNGEELTYDEIMEDITPKIAGECAYIGVNEIGSILGIDPKISYLAGIGIRSSIDSGLEGADPEQIWTSVENGLLQGVASVSINYATQELGLNPLLSNLGFSAIATAINAGIQSAVGGDQNIFQGMYNTYKDNVLTFLGYADPGSPDYEWQQTAYISQIQDFSKIVTEKGFVNALNTYATGFFNTVAANAIAQSGMSIGNYFATKIANKQYTVFTASDGTQYIDVPITAPNLTAGDAFFEKVTNTDGTSNWVLSGKQEDYGDHTFLGLGNLGVDSYAKLGYSTGDVLQDTYNTYKTIETIDSNGNLISQQVLDSNGNVLTGVSPFGVDTHLTYDAYGNYVDAKINNLLSGQTYSFGDAILKYYQELDSADSTSQLNADFSNPSTINLTLSYSGLSASDLANLTAQARQQIVTVLLSNGINNPEPIGVSPAYMKVFAQQLDKIGPGAINAIFIPCYENSPGLLGGGLNLVSWFRNTYFGTNEVTNYLTSEVNLQFSNNPPSNMTWVDYSGSGDPSIKSANANPSWDVHSIVLVDAPIGFNTNITNPNVKNVIMITGLDDLLAAPVFTNRFDNNPQPLNTYNIALIGVSHTDFANTNSNNPTALEVTQFTAYVSTLANNNTKLDSFINKQMNKGAVTYDESLKIYIVDLTKVSYE